MPHLLLPMLAGLALVPACPPAAAPAVTFGIPPAVGAVQPHAPGSWVLSWDDHIDGAVAPEAAKHTMVTLDFIGDRVVGRFAGPVLGEARTAVFSGEIIGGDRSAAILSLRQDEPGYTCLYEAHRTDGGWIGTWRDTRGGAGDVHFRSFDRMVREMFAEFDRPPVIHWPHVVAPEDIWYPGPITTDASPPFEITWGFVEPLRLIGVEPEGPRR